MTPIGASSFVVIFLFLKVTHRRDETFFTSLRRIDFIGNAILVAAMIAVLIAVTWGGVIYDWSTVNILLPLILGFVGIGLFTSFEWSPKLCQEPSVPRAVVSNRTSVSALLHTLLHAIVTYWVYYFVPVYFQAVQVVSSLQSGVNTLPIFAGSLPFAILGGVLLTKFGRYKPLHIFCWVCITISLGLFSILGPNSNPAAWVFVQLLFAIGSGMIVGILLPTVQAPLDEKLVGTSTGMWNFVRYFGCIWGVAIPSAIFNNQCQKLAYMISDDHIASQFSNGQAYQHATQAFLLDTVHDEIVRQQVVGGFQSAMRMVWLSAVAFGGLGLLLSFMEKEVDLRATSNSEFGMQENKTK